MSIILNIGIFIFGLIVGSFLNCIIYRMEQKKSFLKGRSYCPNCKHTLSWKDLIPILSFMMLKGKCRYCGKRISIQYPIVELAAGLLFLLISSFGITISFLYLLIISSLLIIIFIYDLKHYIIPDSIIFSAIIITFLYYVLHKPGLWQNINQVYAAIGASLFFLLIYLASRGKWLGFGDVKLAFFMGLFLGFPRIIVALFFSYLIGAIIGIILILLKKKGLKSEVPFGPFLIIGTYIALFWGSKIAQWYIDSIIL